MLRGSTGPGEGGGRSKGYRKKRTPASALGLFFVRAASPCSAVATAGRAAPTLRVVLDGGAAKDGEGVQSVGVP